jgi:Arc/MetJ family transcription regulator
MCKFLHMATNLAIDDALLNKALKIGGKKTKKDTVNEALKEFIVRREQKKVVDLFGTVDYFDDYEPKKARNR